LPAQAGGRYVQLDFSKPGNLFIEVEDAEVVLLSNHDILYTKIPKLERF
jgi:hypothetical protein